MADIESAHRFHVYCARFPSEIPLQAIKEYSKVGQIVFDPFCGSGTTLVAGLLMGRQVWGSDIDELASLLSWAKTHPDTEKAYDAFSNQYQKTLFETFESISDHIDHVTSNVTSAGEIRVNGYCLALPEFLPLTYWFPPKAVVGLAAISQYAACRRKKTFRVAAELALSASIISKWPNTVSYAMDIDHTRPHRRIRRIGLSKVFSMYCGRLDRVLSALSALRRRYEGMGISNNLDQLAKVFPNMDARNLHQVSDESVDLIVTSPPYFDAVDYPRSHRFSLCWLNKPAPRYNRYIGLYRNSKLKLDEWLAGRAEFIKILPGKVRSDVAKGSKWVTFFEDLRLSLGEMYRVLVSGGTAVCVIADNQVGGVRIAAHQAMVHLSRECGFEVVHVSKRKIEPSKRRFPSGTFGFDGPMRHEHAIVIRRPPKSRIKKGQG
ncbi:MAG: hypothetical protein A3I06_13150 [Candidatus Lindowbacteria bacterium RIFCSPLOWO2_02_FULL_62_12]|nr:MAG: hypothetical protein A3I06_13150 [Candidatus Lindowbacteria bacterium RIFCSPLOWO2_02_FULL_62_12]